MIISRRRVVKFLDDQCGMTFKCIAKRCNGATVAYLLLDWFIFGGLLLLGFYASFFLVSSLLYYCHTFSYFLFFKPSCVRFLA